MIILKNKDGFVKRISGTPHRLGTHIRYPSIEKLEIGYVPVDININALPDVSVKTIVIDFYYVRRTEEGFFLYEERSNG